MKTIELKTFNIFDKNKSFFLVKEEKNVAQFSNIVTVTGDFPRINPDFHF